MRVAFISRNTLFTGRGGDTVQVVKTAEYLRKIGVEVDIYTSSEKINYENYDVLHGFNVIRPADLIGHFRRFKGLKALSTIYVDYSEYDVKGRGGLQSKVFRWLGSNRSEYLKALMRKIKSGEKSFNLAYLFKGHKKALEELIALSHILLPNSESEYRRLASNYKVNKRHVVIPNAIDTGIFKEARDLSSKQKNLVICVARIDGIKNQLNLIRALKDTEFELLLIGKPAPNQLAYYKRCRAEASGNIHFIEEMKQEELIAYYNRASVHAMPSWFETTGLSSLEAAAMGCNIVISNRGDQQEYFERDVFYCEPDDVKSIYEAVLDASHSEFKEDFRKKVLARYTWQRTAEKTLEAYKNCMEEENHPLSGESKKKVLFIMQLPPPVHGASVMNQLIKNSILINKSFDCDYINLATARDIDDLQKNRFSKYLLTLGIIFRTLRMMFSKRYDYVYVTLFPYGLAFIKDSIIVILARLIGLKPILHLHTYGFREGSERSALWKKYYKFIFRNTEVICLSDLLMEDIELIYKGKVYILPNGIPQVNFENRYKNAGDPVTLLFLSNLIKGKGILIIMDALELLKNKGLNFKLRIVGSERDVTYKELISIAKNKGLENHVSIVGAKYREEKYAEYRNAGIFLLPSNYDTFGLVLLEAMQFGVPCISTNIGGIPDVLGDGRGLIIEEISAEALAKAIEYLICNPQVRAEMSRKGFEYFKNNFTDKIFEARLKKILMQEPEIINERLTF